jgi:AcrR family transcriptional regulator
MVVTTESESLPLRERKRLRAMRRVQREAVRRFTADGFAAVTIEEIAAAAEVSPMSIYRWFGTKEALVIWDEFDPPILAAVAERLTTQPTLDAVRDALVHLLDEVYDRERDLALERARLIFAEPAVQAAADRNLRLVRGALADLGVAHGATEVDARVAAAVATTLLEEAMWTWQHHGGRRPLAELITETFAAHRRVS